MRFVSSKFTSLAMSRLHHLKIPSTTADSKQSSPTSRNSNAHNNASFTAATTGGRGRVQVEERDELDKEQDMESSGDQLTIPLPPSAYAKLHHTAEVGGGIKIFSPTIPSSQQQQHPANLSQALLDKTAKDRKALLVYLKSMFLGRGLWLGICRIPLREIGRFYRSSLSAATASAILSPPPSSSPAPLPTSSMTVRVSGLFSLGVGVGTLLRSATPVEFAKALNMLLL